MINHTVHQDFETVSVIGLGYIGLPTAAVIASRKIHVIGVDINASTVETINRGMSHIVEPDLDILVHACITEGYLQATTVAQPASAFLIAVPTPFMEGNQPDLSYIKSAATLIAPVLKQGDLIILESTSPVGTTEQMAEWLACIRTDLTFPQQYGEEADIKIAHCPERVLPGHILRELVQNDRVIGGMTEACSAKAQKFYQTFVEGECIITDVRTAELCKLTENSFRDVNIAFANELSIICDKLNIDVWELISLANRHPRVNILQPGPGVGGHCIAVDPWFIVSSAPKEATLIRAAREVNDSKPSWVLEKIKLAISNYLQAHPNKTVKDVVIACFGLTFKADIDDLRESPALSIVKNIAEFHAGYIVVVEPYIDTLPNGLNGKVELQSIESALLEADIVLLLVDHKSFAVAENLIKKDTIVVDTRGLWSGNNK
ncbi:UDP-N-acetyl-D-mannosamine dehydrogenase [Legionella sp. PC997]|uniref:UDP-N-acetyl-D-mannosamine dehydrogenase n=1 Tax=Legionella sp. PC997 TaxID=2755562 RepID=UPI0015FB3C7B|nr:UDP-N-acetyl-D-mannosamine dehydrogenase [Legionella sp. PC997]QMT58805.1 nucleotide sugar dehydrogenase [Legionella sp. PC997]